MNDTVTKTTDVYLVGHEWSDNSVGVYWFPASSDSVGEWQYARGSALPTSLGNASTATVELQFNTRSEIGTKRGVLNAAGDRMIIGEGGLAGWSKRTGICSSSHSSDAAAANTPPACAHQQRLPANHLDSYRNVQYEAAECEGGAGHVQDYILTAGCPDYGSAGAHFSYNYSSGECCVQTEL